MRKKVSISHLVWEILNASDSPMFLVLNLIDLFGSFLRMMRVKLSNCSIFISIIGLTQLFESSVLFSDWHSNIVKSSYWRFWYECPAVEPVVSKFLEEWITSWCYLPHSVQLTLVWYTVDKAWNKVHAQNSWFKMVTIWFIGLVGWVFTNGLGDQGSIPGQVIPKIQKWYLMPPCLSLINIR